MRKLPTRIGLALAGVAFFSIALAVSVAVIAEPAPKPVAGITNIMNAVNHETEGLYGMIKKFCDGGGQGSADQWKMMRHRAQVMAECGNILMAKSPPRGADDAAGMAKWKQHCANFRDASKKLSKALAFKKMNKVTPALAAVAAQCDACHNDHKSN